MTDASLDTVDLDFDHTTLTVGSDGASAEELLRENGESTTEGGGAAISAFRNNGIYSEAPKNSKSSTEQVDSEVTLETILKHDGPLNVLRALNLFVQSCQAIANEHSRGVIHGDLTPGCIVVSGAKTLCPSCAHGKIRRRFFRWCNNAECSLSAVGGVEVQREVITIYGFGAKRISEQKFDTRTFTRTSDLFRSAQYLSPEQCMGAAIDSRSDIYALGCVLYEALCGKPPFAAENQAKTLLKHLEGEPVLFFAPFISLRSNMYCKEMVPLQLIIRKCLERDPARRYQTADELLDDLKLVESGHMMQCMPKSWPPGELTCFWYPPRGRRFQSKTRFYSTYSHRFNAAVTIGLGVLFILPFLMVPWLFCLSTDILSNVMWMSPGFLGLSVLLTAVVGHRLFRLSTVSDTNINPGDRWLQLLYGSIIVDLVFLSFILFVALLGLPPFYVVNFSEIPIDRLPVWALVAASSMLSLPLVLFPVWLARKIGSDENRSGW